jgi:ABC-type glycerol-3-phosphate transport system substrate-binding protein
MISGDYKTATFYGTGGKDALLFYTQFANAGSPLYTWNESLPKSIDLFAQEGVVIIFNYAAAIPEIKSRNAFLNFAVAPVPQPAAGKDKPFSYPNYWGYTVSRQSRYADLAWDFIISMTTLPQSAEDYLNRSGKPPALKSLIYQNLNEPDLGVFVKQALTAHRAAWPTPDQNKVDEIFVDAILNVVQNRMAADDALLQAQDRVTQLLSRFF